MFHRGHRLWLVAAAGMVVLLLTILWWSRDDGPSRPVPSSLAPASPGAHPDPGAKINLDEALGSASARLAQATDPLQKRQIVSALRRLLTAHSPTESSAVTQRFLDSGADAPTGEGFKPGPAGILAEAPTLRTLLLDHLGQQNPAAAAEYARHILSNPSSPDEWAIALKNLALGDTTPTGAALLRQKTGELLANELWQQNPSAGYLEAFDVAVFLGGTNFAPALAELVRKQDNPAVAHAAYLALDRLVIDRPGDVLALLQTAPALMHGREATRANYFARADVRDPKQRQILEAYLLDPRISPVELGQFAGLYPSGNFMISHNLLTPTPTPDHASLIARDAASLEMVEEWLAQPRFGPIRPQLEKVKQRLEQFRDQAKSRQ